MDYLPIFLDVRNRDCLVVGGGEVAARKVTLLTSANARVHVVAPDICDALQQQAKQGLINIISKKFELSDLETKLFSLIIAATNDEKINTRISDAARVKNIPINVVDNPELCTFTVPSIIDRSPIVVAVSSGGSSPVLARLLRARLETLIPSSYGRLAGMVKGFRQTVKQRFKTVIERRRFWEKVLQGPIAEMMLAGQEKAAQHELMKAVEQGLDKHSLLGEVYLVGAGPGDPDLLTFRALRLLQQADVIVYDRLVSQEILNVARKDAQRIYVGKERDSHTLSQDEINDLLAKLAKEGKRVLRLKGGDPFIFGRGGEEIQKLAAEGIPFQVVPGITAASGCASYSGIPLTHRDYAQSVIFVTGHLKDGTLNLNWAAIAQQNQTIVFYMGLKGLDIISQKLIENGLAHDTPVALIEKGTQQAQNVHIRTLANLPQLTTEKNIKPPTMIIIGKVVELHKTLRWFEPMSN